MNIIAEQMISNPKRVKELYDKLPSTKRAAIEKRDGRKQAEMQASVVALSARDRRASAHRPSGR